MKISKKVEISKDELRSIQRTQAILEHICAEFSEDECDSCPLRNWCPYATFDCGDTLSNYLLGIASHIPVYEKQITEAPQIHEK